jgi:hypothetical protein
MCSLQKARIGGFRKFAESMLKISSMKAWSIVRSMIAVAMLKKNKQAFCQETVTLTLTDVAGGWSNLARSKIDRGLTHYEHDIVTLRLAHDRSYNLTVQ